MNLDDDEKLNRLLRDDVQEYVDDAGFTARVMDTLPASRHPARRRAGLVVGATALSLVLVATFGRAALGSLVVLCSRLFEISIPVAGTPVPLAAFVLCALGCVLAVWSVRGEFRA